MNKKRVYFDDLPIDQVTLKSVVNSLKKLALEKRQEMATVACLNAHNINCAYEDKEYREFLKNADLVIPDGWSVVVAGKVLGYQLTERVTTADYFNDFCQMVEKNKFTCYLLGSKQKVVKQAVKYLKNKFPQLKVVGFHSGFFNEKEEREVIEEINKEQPDFLLVGMGTPKQEKWLKQNKDILEVKVGWGIGAMFDYLAGEKSRAPVWLGKVGLEWFYRLLMEPKRLFKRYTIGNVRFISRCFKILLS
jgi:N-acetylglucosaminyldiphosphoundecaprenol N-acetyl-beta-D-mannosaminyltransferase